jgi:uncharacterized protein YhaN
MKLLSLEVRNFKRFTGTARVSGFGPGLNVLFGRNELGKSTLMTAINAAIFEKSKSSKQEVKDFRHIVNGTVPEVTLAFELGGSKWTVHKRFAYAAGKTTLENDRSLRFEGEEAEEEIRRLFGFETNAKSVESGIWGTLWVEQGQSFAPTTMSDRARRTIEGCIETQVGTVVGGQRGRRIHDAVATALDALLTGSTRAPKGAYKQALQELEAAQADIDDLTRRRNEVTADFDRLTEAQANLRRLQADLSEQNYDTQIEEAEAARTSAVKKAAEIQALQVEVQLAKARVGAALSDVEQRRGLIAEIEQVQQEASDLAPQAAEAAETAKAARTNVAAADETLASAKTALTDARTRVLGLERQRDAVNFKADLDRLDGLLKRALAVRNDHSQRLGVIAGIKATDDGLERIEVAERAVQKAVAMKDAAATDMAFNLTAAGWLKVKIDGIQPDAAQFTRQVSSPIRIDVDGVGSILVEPKIKNISQLNAALEEAKTELLSALAVVDVTTPDEARREVARRRALEVDSKGIAAELRAILQSAGIPKVKTVEDLSIAVEEVRGKLEAEIKVLGGEVPADQTALDAGLKAARKAVDEAQILADEAEARLSEFRQAETRAISADSTIKAEIGAHRAVIKNKQGILDGLRAKDSDEAVTGNAARLAAEMESKAAVVESRMSDTAADVAGTEARLARLRKAREGLQRQTADLKNTVAGLEARLDANASLGLEEKLAVRSAEKERLAARVAGFKQESEVLDLLRGTLEGAESEAKAKYLAPVVSRIQPYLSMLLPGAQIKIDESLAITGLMRGELTENLFDLSLGTQEQLAVLTRLAFADLLMDRNQPATVILDDALVYSDDDRIERMFDILTRASNKTQIIVFTCRRRLFSQLGGNLLEVEETSSS